LHYFSGLQSAQTVLLTHGDSIERVCDKFKVCATSSSDIIAGIYNEQARIYGVQFHPEVDLTVEGKKMLNKFLIDVARLNPSFTINCRKEECIRYIREKVGNNKVLVRFVTYFQMFRRIFYSEHLFSFYAAEELIRLFVQLY
jgi:GMP synthase (glutamine-hydrolysing)